MNMKYIKYFESDLNDCLYKQITVREFDRIVYPAGYQFNEISDDMIEFTEKEIDYLRQVSSIFTYPYEIMCHLHSKIGSFTIHCFKTEDEFYYIFISANNTYYECDSFQGVKNLINDLK